MKSSAWILIGLFVTAAVVVFRVFDSGALDDGIGEGGAPAVSAEEPGAKVRRGPSSPSERSTSPSPRVAKPVPPTARRGLLFQVYDKATGKSLAGIDVYVLEQNEEIARKMASLSSEDPGLFTDRFQMIPAIFKPHPTDDQGEVRIQIPTAATRCLALGRGYVGEIGVPRQQDQSEGTATDPSERIRIAVQKMTSFHAQVVDSLKRPVAGVEVQLLKKGGRAISRAMTRGVTDGEGRVELRVDPGFADQGIDVPRISQWSVPGVFRDPFVADMQSGSDPANPQVLELPDFGWIDLALLDHRGEVLEEVVGLWVREAPTADASSRTPRTGARRRPASIRGSSRAGRARLGPIAVGLEVEVTATPPGRCACSPKDFRIPGPTTVGATEPRTLQWKKKALVLTGRVIGDDGRPFANKTIGYRFQSFGAHVAGSGGRKHMSTDAEGRFGQRIPESFYDGSSGTQAMTHQFVELHRVSRRKDEPFKTAWFDITERLVNGDLDLGDVVMKELPVLFRGRVVDGGGRGVEGVSFGLKRALSSPQRQTRAVLGIIKASRSGANGAFVIRGILNEDPDAKFSLSYSKSGFQRPEPVEVSLQDPELELVLGQSGRLKARVILANPTDLDSVAYSLKPESGAGDLRSWTSLGRGGVIDRGNLAPGAYRLRVLTRQHQVLLEKKNIAVDPGRTTDLGDLLVKIDTPRFELVFRNAQGAPVERVWLASADPGGKNPRFSDFTHRSTFVLHQAADELRLQLSAEGYLTQTRTVRPGKNVITFAEPPQVTIRFDGSWPRLKSDEGIIVTAEGLEHTLKPDADGQISSSETIDYRPPKTGRVELRLRLALIEGFSIHSAAIPAPASGLIVSITESGSQEITVTLPVEFENHLATAREELRKRLGR